MNREIEFRGFDGREWRYGDLEYNRKTGIARIHTYKEDGSYDKQYAVDPDTVGEFTGMRDRHGNKVFEGDVVDVYDFTSAYASKYRGVVKMYRGSWCVEYEDSIFDTVFHPMLFFDDFADRKTEVVGNIHNNPELLFTK
jgi:uncharacterized phage protein (TIGR01671 family)